eukprot:scaffold168080_cov30-Tisochrysis_lutea.AAC.1
MAATLVDRSPGWSFKWGVLSFYASLSARPSASAFATRLELEVSLSWILPLTLIVLDLDEHWGAEF